MPTLNPDEPHFVWATKYRYPILVGEIGLRAREIIRDRTCGKVLSAVFRRLSSSPGGWTSVNWFMDPRRSGGCPLDLHIHDTDYVQYLFGTPKAVCSFGDQVPAGGGLGRRLWWRERFARLTEQLFSVPVGRLQPQSGRFPRRARHCQRV